MTRLIILIFVVWVAGVVIMQHGGPGSVLASLTLPHVIH